jgi:ribosomal 50S subunit-recycling heat shock protein
VRLDAYLVAARLFKRRSLAKRACDAGAVLLAGRPAKASRQVRPGDVLIIEYPSARCTVEVAKLPDGSVRRSEAQELYIFRAREARSESLFEPASEPSKE